MIKENVRKVFSRFASQDNGLVDNQKFRKVLLACELLPNLLAINEIDITYSASKAHYKESQS